MQVEVVVLTDFMHGNINAVQDSTMSFDESLAGEFERAGLVRIKTVPQHQFGADAGKALAAGQDQLSSALPAAQVLPRTTLHLPKRGYGKTGRHDT